LSSWSVWIGNTFDFFLTFLFNSEGNDGKIRSTDASSAWLSLSLSCPSWSVSSCLYFN
jgi:hypothetical protein